MINKDYTCMKMYNDIWHKIYIQKKSDLKMQSEISFRVHLIDTMWEILNKALKNKYKSVCN